MGRRPKNLTGECSTCKNNATYRSNTLDGIWHQFCDSCYRELRKMSKAGYAKKRALLTKSPYPYGNRRTFMAKLENRELKRVVTKRFINAANMNDFGHLVSHTRKHGDIKWNLNITSNRVKCA